MSHLGKGGVEGSFLRKRLFSLRVPTLKIALPVGIRSPLSGALAPIVPVGYPYLS